MKTIISIEASNGIVCHSEPAKHGEESPADGAVLVLRQGIPLRASPDRNDNDRSARDIDIGDHP
jgi:hypothetical protein